MASTDWATQRLGQILAQRYRIVRLLGKGAMGAVYEVQHIKTGGSAAAKILHAHWGSDEDVYERFRIEAQIGARLKHPHIAAVTDFDQTPDGSPFLVMEMLQGETLAARLARHGRLPFEAVIAIAHEVGDALQAAHDHRIVHRDLKPENIFLTQQQHEGRVVQVTKVLDFGVSKLIQSFRQRTRENQLFGTPYYISPEAVDSATDTDGRADQFSLAVILYQALSGSMPFQGTQLMGVLWQVKVSQPPALGPLVPGLPPYAVEAIERALSKDRNDRFPTIWDFVAALKGLQCTPERNPLPRFSVTSLLNEKVSAEELFEDDGLTTMVDETVDLARLKVGDGLTTVPLARLQASLPPPPAAKPASPSPVQGAPHHPPRMRGQSLLWILVLILALTTIALAIALGILLGQRVR